VGIVPQTVCLVWRQLWRRRIKSYFYWWSVAKKQTQQQQRYHALANIVEMMHAAATMLRLSTELRQSTGKLPAPAVNDMNCKPPTAITTRTTTTTAAAKAKKRATSQIQAASKSKFKAKAKTKTKVTVQWPHVHRQIKTSNYNCLRVSTYICIFRPCTLKKHKKVLLSLCN